LKYQIFFFIIYFSQPTSKNRVNIAIPVTFSAFSEKRMAHKKEGTLRFFARPNEFDRGTHRARGTLRFFARPNEFDRGTHRARLFVSNRVGRGPSYRFCVELIPVFPFCVHRVSFGLFALVIIVQNHIRRSSVIRIAFLLRTRLRRIGRRRVRRRAFA